MHAPSVCGTAVQTNNIIFNWNGRKEKFGILAYKIFFPETNSSSKPSLYTSFHENCMKSVAMAMENVKITFMAITSVLIKIVTSKLAYYVAYG